MIVYLNGSYQLTSFVFLKEMPCEGQSEFPSYSFVAMHVGHELDHRLQDGSLAPVVHVVGRDLQHKEFSTADTGLIEFVQPGKNKTVIKRAKGCKTYLVTASIFKVLNQTCANLPDSTSISNILSFHR